jgi:uncharacterized MAPEG superfamily protein
MMGSPSFFALVGFIGWTLALLALMEIVRSLLVVSRGVPANGFQPDNANLSPFMQRLARAHANCIEGLPVFGGLLLAAVAADLAAVTDPLAPALLAARVFQSTVHLVATSAMAVTVRFLAFSIQVAIAAWWVVHLLAAAA